MILKYVFEFDGVVLDSADDIFLSLKETLQHFGYRKIEKNDVLKFLFCEYETLIKNAVLIASKSHFNIKNDVAQSKVSEMVDFFSCVFEKNSEKTQIFLGIPELLKTLKKKKKKCYLVTRRNFNDTKKNTHPIWFRKLF